MTTMYMDIKCPLIESNLRNGYTFMVIILN